MPVGVSAIVSIEGTNNFRQEYAPALGASISRDIGKVAAGLRRADVGAQHRDRRRAYARHEMVGLRRESAGAPDACSSPERSRRACPAT